MYSQSVTKTPKLICAKVAVAVHCNLKLETAYWPSSVISRWHGFPSEVCPVCLPKYCPMEVVGSDLSAAFKKIFDLRLEEVQFLGVFLDCDWSARILLPFITMLHEMQTRSSDENSVCLPICPSVCLSVSCVL